MGYASKEELVLHFGPQQVPYCVHGGGRQKLLSPLSTSTKVPKFISEAISTGESGIKHGAAFAVQTDLEYILEAEKNTCQY
jgi:hypothetical protein